MTERKKLAKTQQVLVRLDDYERQRLEEIAAAWGVTLSAAARRLIRESTVGQGYIAKAGEALISQG